MNAFLWKKMVILKKGMYKKWVIILFPIIFSILFWMNGVESNYSLLLSSICTSLLFPSFTWDIEDLINQEIIQVNFFNDNLSNQTQHLM